MDKSLSQVAIEGYNEEKKVLVERLVNIPAHQNTVRESVESRITKVDEKIQNLINAEKVTIKTKTKTP